MLAQNEALHELVPLLLRCRGQAQVLQSVDKADAFTPLGYAIAHNQRPTAELLWQACRADKVRTVRALIGPQQQRITNGLKQPLFLAVLRQHWFDHAWLGNDSALELQTVYLQVSHGGGFTGRVLLGGPDSQILQHDRSQFEALTLAMCAALAGAHAQLKLLTSAHRLVSAWRCVDTRICLCRATLSAHQLSVTTRCHRGFVAWSEHLQFRRIAEISSVQSKHDAQISSVALAGSAAASSSHIAGNARFGSLMAMAVDHPDVLDQDGHVSLGSGVMRAGHLICVLHLLHLGRGMSPAQHATLLAAMSDCDLEQCTLLEQEVRLAECICLIHSFAPGTQSTWRTFQSSLAEYHSR
ncbi:hypothetical protein MMC07_009744 [Pseudocyphellaria aurata]|nr:hypothetical protein [Pseudocyphellaria aurata]